MEQEAIDTISQAASSVTQQAIEFTMDVRPINQWQSFLQRTGLKPKVKTFSIQPVVLGNLQRISALLLSILPEKTQVSNANLMDVAFQAAAKHAETLARICAIAIRNSRTEPPKSLVLELLSNMTAKEMVGILSIVLKQLDVSNFILSIISIRGLNVLESEPRNQSEMSPMEQGR